MIMSKIKTFPMLLNEQDAILEVYYQITMVAYNRISAPSLYVIILLFIQGKVLSPNFYV